MANTFAPFGFAETSKLGGAVNYQMMTRKIASGNSSPIFFGDPVVSLNTGYIAQATAGTTQIAGIFAGCSYMSTARKTLVTSWYWPGSDAASDPECKVIVDPQAVFLAQGNGICTLAKVGGNMQFAIGTGNTATGISGAYLDITGTSDLTTTTLPFRVVALYDQPAGANGTDTTSAYNYAFVAFNWQDFRSTTGI